ncbi:MAG: FecR domain-containing protein [Arenicellales bacterium]
MAAIGVTPPELIASTETQVGVTATSNIGSMGKPPLSPVRNLDTGVEVYFQEVVSTDANGRAQLLFQDGTALTLGPNSDLVIDEFAYDPATGQGKMTIDMSRGVFRLVGGKLSKNKPITFNTPSANVEIRGGMFTGAVTESKTDMVLLFGELKMTLPSGQVSRTTVPGTIITANMAADRSGSLSRQRVKPQRLASITETLEKSSIQETVITNSPSLNQPSTTADNSNQGQIEITATKASTESEIFIESTGAISDTSIDENKAARQSLKAKSKAEKDARKERRQARKAERKTRAQELAALSKDLSGKKSRPITNSTAITFSRGRKEVVEAGLVTSKNQTGTDAPIVTDIDEDGDAVIGCDSEEDCSSITIFEVDDDADADADDNESAGSGTSALAEPAKLTKKEKKAKKKVAKQQKKAAVAKKKAAKAAAKQAKAVKKAAAKAEKKKKKEAKAAAKKKAAEEKKKKKEAKAAAKKKAAEEKKKKKKKKKKKCDESDPDCTVSRPTAIALLDDGAGTTLRADAYAYGKPIGTVVSSGSSSALCNDCRFLNWQRQPLYVSGEAIGLHYWVQGASATAKDLAAAAGKTATYQGGMIGSVAESGALREATGHFNSRVNFGVSQYQVTHFNANFDRNRFSGSSAATANNQPFGVTAGALSGRDSGSDLTLNASGYFGGTPATPSAPPPEMGGSFSITGDNYSANGVFVGRQ